MTTPVLAYIISLLYQRNKTRHHGIVAAASAQKHTFGGEIIWTTCPK